MKSSEFITEGLAHPIIVVDVQPEYVKYGGYETQDVCEKIIHFVTKQTGPVLMFINAEETGVSGDTKEFIKKYWENVDTPDWDDLEDNYDEDGNYKNSVEPNINWNRFTIVDKGFGYFRSWQSFGISDATIIKVVRAMYQLKISDSREFEDSSIDLPELVGPEWEQKLWYDPLTVDWTSVAQLKKFSGAYLVGGGRNECLWEVKILMNAFNIRAKLVDSLIYG